MVKNAEDILKSLFPEHGMVEGGNEQNDPAFMVYTSLQRMNHGHHHEYEPVEKMTTDQSNN